MKKKLALILLLCIFPVIASSQTRDIMLNQTSAAKQVYTDSWALLIAIDEYQNVPKLNYAKADAESVKDFLIKNGGFRADHVFTLYDKDATRQNIQTMLGTQFRSKVGKDDRVLVYFAGHGQTDTLPNGKKMGYLIPVEGQANNLYGTCLSMNTVRETSDMLASKHIFYVVDACYSGIAGIETRSIPMSDPSLYLKKLTSQRAVQIVTAGQANETVIEGQQFGGGHSVFTWTLLNGLTMGNADVNGDGIIPASELYAYLAPRITRDSNGHQTPKLFNMSGDGEFVFFVSPNSALPSFSEPAPVYSQPAPVYSAPVTPPTQEKSPGMAGVDPEILEMLIENLNAAEDEDLKDYMKSISKNSPSYKPTKKTMKSLFRNYDLDYDLISLEVIDIDETSAKIKFVQHTKKISGPTFRDNIFTGYHYLVREDGEWKIFSSEEINVEFLDAL